MEMFPGFYHAIFHEKDRHRVVDTVRAFVRQLFSEPPACPSMLDADKHGFTKDEYDRLCRPSGLRFAFTRLSMRTLGRLSRGIRLGWQAGFDSGLTLDYVYQNRAQGITPLGRWIDRAYLNSIGWRGIRVRRANLERVLVQTIKDTHAAGRTVRLLDIASGPGRYVLETIRRLDIPITAVLRDYKQENLETASKLAAELGLTNVTISHGDAFDAASLAAVTPRPTIAIVSGLYELFPDNEPVRRSLYGLAQAVEPGGHLLYTNQPWHPQVDFIARVLTNRDGKPWIMRRRTQAEMDELVRAAGFEKISQQIDPWGIFTVSVARRVAT
jgi:SAM-dependent methyltransferase